MAIGRAKGEYRVEKAIIDALDSPLLHGNDIRKAKRILFNIYASDDYPVLIPEMQEVDEFFDQLDPDIDVIWGTSTDETLGEDAKVIILATDMDDKTAQDNQLEFKDDYYDKLIKTLYKPQKKKETITTPPKPEEEATKEQEPPLVVKPAIEEPKPEPVTPGEDTSSGIDKLKSWLDQKIKFLINDDY